MQCLYYCTGECNEIGLVIGAKQRYAVVNVATGKTISVWHFWENAIEQLDLGNEQREIRYID